MSPLIEMEVWALVLPVALAVLFLVQRLWESEVRFRMITENTDDVVCYHDAEGRCLYVSPSAERLLGRFPPVCPGERALPDDCEIVQAAQARIMGGTTVRFTYRVLHSSGRVLWVETVGRPVPGKGSSAIFSSRDVTARKHAEGLYRLIADSLPMTGFLLYDRDFRVQVAAGRLAGWSGGSREMIEGRLLSEVFRLILDPEHLTAVHERGAAALAGSETTYEFPFHGFIYENHFVPVVSEGVIIAGLLVSIDVTARRRADAALQERTEDLERSNCDLALFADIASHELKTPLRHISGFAELLAEEHVGLLSPEADEYIAGVVRGVREMTGVIEALLRYSRAKSNENRMQSVDLAWLVRQALLSLAPRISEVGGFVDVAWDTLPTVRGDPVLLKQLLENLIWNGLKFSQPEPVVRVGATRDPSDWIVTVEDNGPGVDPEHREMIFQMFKRSRTDVEGSGIGLALCKKIAGIHRGKIWVEPGQGLPERPGAVFCVSLPARAWDEAT